MMMMMCCCSCHTSSLLIMRPSRTIIIRPKLRSSLSSVVLSSPNTIAAVAVSGSVHGAVSSAITQLAVTAVAIASGACLSTKVDCRWPKLVEDDQQPPGSLVLDGVDVSGYPIFMDPKVLKAIAFARKAHHGQIRMTGEPYLSHCIHTGKILAVLVPSNGKRAIDTLVAGILHDVVDDTRETLYAIERDFDADVAKLVAGVSRLSYINQANNLRVMLLGMVDDPCVVLIKLADRLHNMRTMGGANPGQICTENSGTWVLADTNAGPKLAQMASPREPSFC